MLSKPIFVSLLASSALTLAVVSPALADKEDHAREAVSAAEAKLQTAMNLGAGADSPGEIAQAQAMVANAKEDFKSDHEEQAIREANQASAFADTAIAVSQKHRDQAVASARANQRATAADAQGQIAAAQDQAAAAQDQAAAARGQADAAQAQVAQANARADAAEQSAQSAAADAAAARSAAVETTVTTQQATNMRHPLHRKVVTHTTTAAAAPVTTDQVTTTTKVVPQ